MACSFRMKMVGKHGELVLDEIGKTASSINGTENESQVTSRDVTSVSWSSFAAFFFYVHHDLFNEMSAAESDSEGDWEEVLVPEEEKNLEITIATRSPQEKSVLALLAALMTYSLQKIATIQLGTSPSYKLSQAAHSRPSHKRVGSK